MISWISWKDSLTTITSAGSAKVTVDPVLFGRMPASLLKTKKYGVSRVFMVWLYVAWLDVSSQYSNTSDNIMYFIVEPIYYMKLSLMRLLKELTIHGGTHTTEPYFSEKMPPAADDELPEKDFEVEDEDIDDSQNLP